MDMIGIRRKHSLPASCTVEASYVMAIVILSLALLIRTAYEQCRETTGVMRLQHIVEFVRCQEDGQQKEFSFQDISGNALRKVDTVYGTAAGSDWKKEIESDVYEPENRMRMLTIFDNMAEGDRDDGGT